MSGLRPREMWASDMFVLFVADPAALLSRLSPARRNLTNCFPFSHVREPLGNACMQAGTSERGSERESAFGHSYLRTYSPSLSLSLTTFTPSFPRRRGRGGRGRSFATAAGMSVRRSVDGSWPFICIANYENETERGGEGEADYEEGTKMRSCLRSEMPTT